MSDNESGGEIWLVSTDLGPGVRKGVWSKIDPQALAEQIDRLATRITHALSLNPPGKTDYVLSEIKISATISADGSLGILGSGLQAGSSASIEITLSRTTRPTV